MSVISELAPILGEHGLVTGDAIESRHLIGTAGATGETDRPIAVVYPRTTEEVSAILAVCNAHRQALVPHGGLTGLAGGARPSPDCVVLSLERMRTIEEVDPVAGTLTAQAGAALESIQTAAEEADLFFPLDLGARGSCQIGGNVSTNAGGNRVLRYGMARDLVLGVEAVLADGTIVPALNKMLKNNTGYDVKQLFIGSEGTLGVITRVVLRLFPKTQSLSTALCAVPDYEAVKNLLGHVRSGLGPTLSAFEMMWPDFYATAARVRSGRPPLPEGHGAYVLLDAMGLDQERDQRHFEGVVAEAMEAGFVEDAVIAQSLQEAGSMWEIRDMPGEFSRVFGERVDFDVSIPIDRIGEFAVVARQRLLERWPAMITLFWGHVADSNVHLLATLADGSLPVEAIDDVVYGIVREFGGSISAEHGIGLLKKPYLHYSCSEAEIAVMKRIKSALDPAGILNPGKVI